MGRGREGRDVPALRRATRAAGRPRDGRALAAELATGRLPQTPENVPYEPFLRHKHAVGTVSGCSCRGRHAATVAGSRARPVPQSGGHSLSPSLIDRSISDHALDERLDRREHRRRERCRFRWNSDTFFSETMVAQRPLASRCLGRHLVVVPEHVVHPGLLGGWWLSKTISPRRTPDEDSR